RLEKQVLTEASKIVVIGNTMKQDYVDMGIDSQKIEVITNGFDEEDLPEEDIPLDSKFSLVHLGTLNRSRNPLALWKALKSLANDRPRFTLGPSDGDLAEILSSTKAGKTVGFDDQKAIKNEISRFYGLFKEGLLCNSPENVSRYSRKNLTHDLAEVMNGLLVE